MEDLDRLDLAALVGNLDGASFLLLEVSRVHLHRLLVGEVRVGFLDLVDGLDFAGLLFPATGLDLLEATNTRVQLDGHWILLGCSSLRLYRLETVGN